MVKLPMGSSPVTCPSYAVIFRTHFWDDFTRRQFAKLKARTKTGRVFVLVDETGGRVEGIEHPDVVRMTEKDSRDAGYPAKGEGAVLWFNGDYPLYHFRRLHPEFDLYLQLEYDVIINVDLDGLAASIAADGADFVGLSRPIPPLEWFYASTCTGAYPTGKIRHQLICLSVFSGRALDLLSRRRIEMAHDLAAGKITSWPMCEGFIATEMADSGLKLTELSRYGGTESYDFWPPYVESIAPQLTGHAFLHPVLDEKRFIPSVLKYTVGIADYFNPSSLMHRKFRTLGTAGYIRTLRSAQMRVAFRSAVNRKLRQAGLSGAS